MVLTHTLAFDVPRIGELLVILIVGLLLFGRRLPEVARSLGKAIVEFKKGMKGIEDDAERASEPPPRVSVREEERVPALPAASVATAPAPEPEPEKKPETPAGSGS